MKEEIGQQLKKARLAQSLTLEQVAQDIYIKPRYLEALENGEYESLPSMVQARGFLRAYAAYLKLDVAALLSGLGEPTLPLPRDVSPSTVTHQPDPLPANTEVKNIFKEIGQQLQRQREILGLTLEDIAQHTHLRMHNLQQLEAGDFDQLPSPVQARGMLNNYAAFLGLDAEALMLRFAEGLQARWSLNRERTLPRPARNLRLPMLPWQVRRLVSGELLLTAVVLVVLVVSVFATMVQVFRIRSQQRPTPTAPSIADVLLAVPTLDTGVLEVTPTAAPQAVVTATLQIQALPTGGDTSAPLAKPTLAGKVQLNIVGRQRAWMRVVVDGKIEFEGRVAPGGAYQFAGDKQIEVVAGDGAALQITYNQQDQGEMGNFGQVVDRIYTAQGVFSPTATVTPTPTKTPKPSPTPRQSPTPSPTPAL